MKNRGDSGRGRIRRRIGVIVLTSLGAHVVVFLVFGLVVVVQFFEEPEATFVVSGEVVIPAETREHRMEMAAREAAAPQPAFTEKLVSTALTDFAFPEPPDTPHESVDPLDPEQWIAAQMTSLAGTRGLGSGMGTAIEGAGGEGDGMSFFDIRDAAASVVIMVDVSASMFGRTGDLDYDSGKLLRRGREQSFQRIRDEALSLIEGLGVNTRFNLIHWSGSARVWREQLVPASPANKEAARQHVASRFDHGKAGPTGGRPGGTRHDYALEALFELGAESAFMLTDGNATRSRPGGGFETISDRELLGLIDTARSAHPALPRIHTIYYLTGRDRREEERMLRGIARRTGGEFRKVEAEAPPGD